MLCTSFAKLLMFTNINLKLGYHISKKENLGVVKLYFRAKKNKLFQPLSPKMKQSRNTVSESCMLL